MSKRKQQNKNLIDVVVNVSLPREKGRPTRTIPVLMYINLIDLMVFERPNARCVADLANATVSDGIKLKLASGGGPRVLKALREAKKADPGWRRYLPTETIIKMIDDSTSTSSFNDDDEAAMEARRNYPNE